jgi:hypothetical protein
MHEIVSVEGLEILDSRGPCHTFSYIDIEG